VFAIALSWTFVYVDSILQRRRAERLIADLKSFPFAIAGFNEVRELVARNRGSIQHPPQTMSSDCPSRDCNFRIEINHPLIPLPLEGYIGQFEYEALVYAGIRPWGVRADFFIKEGKLSETATGIGQIYLEKTWSGKTIPAGREYRVFTASNGINNGGHPGYTVIKPHVTGDGEILETWAAQKAGVPMDRVFDVHLRCFTSILHGCRDFSELAPSAWADHERQN